MRNVIFIIRNTTMSKRLHICSEMCCATLPSFGNARILDLESHHEACIITLFSAATSA